MLDSTRPGTPRTGERADSAAAGLGADTDQQLGARLRPTSSKRRPPAKERKSAAQRGDHSRQKRPERTDLCHNPLHSIDRGNLNRDLSTKGAHLERGILLVVGNEANQV